MKNLEFKSQICTDINQSRKLLELGLKKKTADMCHFWHWESDDYSRLCASWEFAHRSNKDIPAWSLHRLLEMQYADIGECMIFFPNTYEEIIGDIENRIRRGTFNKDYLEDKK